MYQVRALPYDSALLKTRFREVHGDGRWCRGDGGRDSPFAMLRVLENELASAKRDFEVGQRGLADASAVDPDFSPGHRVQIQRRGR